MTKFPMTNDQWEVSEASDDTPDPIGWLIVGHGTRDWAGQGEFVETARLLGERTSAPVGHCFLELAEPTIQQGLGELAARGVRRVLVVPLLLFAAGHAKQDVPNAVASAAAELGIEVVGQAGALENHPKLLELSQLRFRAVATEGDESTILLLVGRGGSDASAIAAAKSYTTELVEQINSGATAGLSSSAEFISRLTGETAFVAVAKPSVPEMLAAIAARQPRRVIVQPHLLFQGEVLTTIREHVAAVADRHLQIDWRVAPHLGPHPLLVEAIVSRIDEALVNR